MSDNQIQEIRIHFYNAMIKHKNTKKEINRIADSLLQSGVTTIKNGGTLINIINKKVSFYEIETIEN